MHGIKSFSIILLVFINLGSTLLVPLIYLDFEVRRDYISKVLCIERNKPITVCKGSCYLSKQLELAHGQQEKEERITVNLMVFFFQQTEPLQLSNKGNLTKQNLIFSLDPFYQNPSLGGVFHPPSLV